MNIDIWFTALFGYKDCKDIPLSVVYEFKSNWFENKAIMYYRMEQ